MAKKRCLPVLRRIGWRSTEAQFRNHLFLIFDQGRDGYRLIHYPPGPDAAKIEDAFEYAYQAENETRRRCREIAAGSWTPRNVKPNAKGRPVKGPGVPPPPPDNVVRLFAK